MKLISSQLSLFGRQHKLISWQSAILVLGLAVFGWGGVCFGQNAEADRLFALAKLKQAGAHQLRDNAAVKLQQAADDEAQAGANQREARILVARALQLLKAGPNRQKAFQLRHDAQVLSAEADAKWISARNTEQKAAQCRHNAEELMKAVQQVKDQANIATSLENDARIQGTEGRRLEMVVNTEKAEAEGLQKRAEAAWAEAEKLDPEAHRQLAPPPAKIELRPAVTH